VRYQTAPRPEARIGILIAMYRIAETVHEGHPAVVLRSPLGLEATYAPGVGMVGCSLRHQGEELLGQRGGLAKYAASGSTFGIPLLHPWANRLEKPYGDSPLIRRDPHGLAIHGVLNASPHWRVADTEADEQGARLSAALDFGAHSDLLVAFPFPHEIEMDVRLEGSALSVETTVRPTGDVPVPISFGYHPYLRLPGVAREDWRIELPVGRHLLLDERSIPTGETEPAGDLDGPLGDREFDDGYCDLEPPPTFALDGGGRRIEVRFGGGYPYAQVYAPAGQELICFEPMTAPTNALVSGWDLPIAQPGGRFSADFELRVTSL
jgi:aldose 1-epimerase